MAFDPVTTALQVGGKLIDHFFPDPAQKAEAQLKLNQMAQDGRLKELGVSMSAIIAEAQSPDPWTSRARPSFMYIIYVVILMGIPMGFLSAFRPEIATQVASGFSAWLSAVPDSLWALFGAGYLGYTGARTWEKGKGVSK